MNSFEGYTLAFGIIALVVEIVKYLKKKFKTWFHHG